MGCETIGIYQKTSVADRVFGCVVRQMNISIWKFKRAGCDNNSPDIESVKIRPACDIGKWMAHLELHHDIAIVGYIHLANLKTVSAGTS